MLAHMKEKKCTKCGEVKPFSEYQKNKQAKNGLRSECKVCKNAYYKANKEVFTERNNRHRENNPEYREQYYKENKDRILAYQKQYQKENKESIAEYQKQYYKAKKEKLNKNLWKTQKLTTKKEGTLRPLPPIIAAGPSATVALP